MRSRLVCPQRRPVHLQFKRSAIFAIKKRKKTISRAINCDGCIDTHKRSDDERGPFCYSCFDLVLCTRQLKQMQEKRVSSFSFILPRCCAHREDVFLRSFFYVASIATIFLEGDVNEIPTDGYRSYYCSLDESEANDYF